MLSFIEFAPNIFCIASVAQPPSAVLLRWLGLKSLHSRGRLCHTFAFSAKNARSAIAYCFKRLMTLALLAGVIFAQSGCSQSEGGVASEDEAAGAGARPNELIVFHAGSLALPLREVSELFMQRHPAVKVKAEASGSRDAARKVSDLGRQCDVLASADYMVVQNLLMPDHADFNIRFATNELAIAFTEDSKYAGEINAENWPDVLLRKSVAVGRSDPNRDPCGYRSVMAMQLAELHYDQPGFAEKLLAKDGKKYIRPKETDLLALVEAGEIDYLFIYRSVVVQHGLKLIELPDEVNLKSPEHADFYRQATVEVTGKQPGEFITRQGEPMVYSVTVPLNAPHRELAEEYVALLLSPEGQAIMEKNGQPALKPLMADGREHLPDGLLKVIK